MAELAPSRVGEVSGVDRLLSCDRGGADCWVSSVVASGGAHWSIVISLAVGIMFRLEGYKSIFVN